MVADPAEDLNGGAPHGPAPYLLLRVKTAVAVVVAAEEASAATAAVAAAAAAAVAAPLAMNALAEAAATAAVVAEATAVVVAVAVATLVAVTAAAMIAVGTVVAVVVTVTVVIAAGTVGCFVMLVMLMLAMAQHGALIGALLPHLRRTRAINGLAAMVANKMGIPWRLRQGGVTVVRVRTTRLRAIAACRDLHSRHFQRRQRWHSVGLRTLRRRPRHHSEHSLQRGTTTRSHAQCGSRTVGTKPSWMPALFAESLNRTAIRHRRH